MSIDNKGTADIIDLDEFLLKSQGGSQTPPAKLVQMPGTDRMAVVGIMVDNSGSMQHLVKPVITGLEKCAEAFEGARGSDFYMLIRDFRSEIFSGLLKDLDKSVFKRYCPDFNFTPIVAHSAPMLKDLHRKAAEYRGMGFPTTVAMLILTDGEANEDSDPSEFANIIEGTDYIVGMGIVYRDGSDTPGRYYRNLFGNMGIERVVTPSSDPADIRHEINQFSRSVASIAS